MDHFFKSKSCSSTASLSSAVQPARTASASAGSDAGQPASRAESMPLSRTVVLVSLGWNKEGGKFLREHFPAVDWTVLWHRIDLLFDAQEHLDWYGTDSRAQE